jgi:hypothetical protein
MVEILERVGELRDCRWRVRCPVCGESYTTMGCRAALLRRRQCGSCLGKSQRRPGGEYEKKHGRSGAP